MSNPFKPVQILTLPISKQKIRARRFSLMTTVIKTGLPAELTSVVLRAYSGEENLLGTPENDLTKMRALMEIVEEIVPLFLVNLTVGESTNTELDADGCLTGVVNMADLPDLDKQYIYMYGRYLVDPERVKGEATTESLDTFRDRTGSADGGPDREALRPAAEQPAPALAAESAGT